MRSAMQVGFYVCLLAALASRAGSQPPPAARKQSGRAAQDFRSAVAKTSAVYQALNLAGLYVQQGRMLDAQIVLAAAIDRHPQDGNVYYALGLLRFAENRLPEAEKLARAAHFYPSHSPDAHLLLAKIYAREGKSDDTLRRRQLHLYMEEAPPSPARDHVRAILDGKIQGKEK